MATNSAKILIIDDQEMNRDMFGRRLTRKGYAVETAESGFQGLNLIQQKSFDLILLDIMMPDLGGIEVLKSIRKSYSAISLPVIMVTAKTQSESVVEALNLGANDYITKPIDFSIALARIKTHLSLKDAEAKLRNSIEKEKELALEQSERKLEDLRNNLSMALPHELKTPLSSILGYSDFIINYIDNLARGEIIEYTKLINKAGNRLNNIIQNFLVYAQLEMIAKDPIKIAQWRSEVFNYTKHTIEYLARKIAKKFSRENDLVLNVTDSDVNIPESNLNKITEEIVDNAFKFSKAGTKVVVEAGNKNNDTLQFNVSNEGPGMTPEQINGIGAFQQFERKMNEQQGSGLGLIIARRMVELQGGKFKIISEPDKKTTVQITLSTHA